jgi:Flp pilus assembly protein TadG
MLKRLIADSSGSAAAEMILVVPLLVGLMFGTMELGNYFYSEHVVVKGVRDGARFASREGFEKFTCTGSGPGTVDSGVQQDTERVTRTNQVAAGGSARLFGWTDDTSVTVTLNCADNSSNTYGSIYNGVSGNGVNVVPVVTVSASVPYKSLFSRIGFNAASLQLNAQAQASVTGG